MNELDAIEELEAAELADKDQQVAMSYMTYIRQSIEQIGHDHPVPEMACKPPYALN